MIDEMELDTLNKIGPQQCDQMSELKVTHFVKKLQKLANAVFTLGKNNVLKNNQKSCPIFGLLLYEDIFAKTFQK